MADLNPVLVTPVVQASTTQLAIIRVGEVTAAMSALYWDSTTERYNLGDADDADKIVITHLSLTSAAAEGYVIALPAPTDGVPVEIDPGVTLSKDTEYVLSASTGGKIAPRADLTTGDYYVSLFVAKTTSVGLWLPKNYGFTVS